MSTVKISELTAITSINANTSNTLLMGVDIPTDITGKFTVHTLAQGLYSNEVLNVGGNPVTLSNTVAQFAGSDPSFLQTNIQNFDANGSADHVATSDIGTNSNNFIDLGINNSGFNGGVAFSSMKALDGYLYVHGSTDTSSDGNLIIGTASTNANVYFIAGNTRAQNIVATLTKSGLVMSTNTSIVFPDGSRQNTAYVGPSTTANNASANTVILQGIALTQNANTTLAFSYINSANANISTLYGIESTQNTNIQSAWNTANAALANTTGTFNGSLTLTGNLIAAGIQSTTGAISTGNLIVNGSTTSNGTANIIGTLNVNGIVTMNAQVVLTNTSFSNTQAALTISATPTVTTPSQDGYMIHISGKQNVSSRIVADSFGANTYVVYAGRSARGNVTNPSGVLAGDILSRFSGNGFGTTGYAPIGSGRLDIVATENHTDTARGTQLQLWNTPVGSNVLTNIATFNGVDVVFTGEVNPQKGLVLTPNVLSGMVTSLSIDIANNSVYYFKTNNTTTISLSGFKAGKIVEVWITNTDTGGSSNHTITHGCLANNSTVGATSFTLTSLHSAYIKYFSIDGDQANTFCQVSYS